MYFTRGKLLREAGELDEKEVSRLTLPTLIWRGFRASLDVSAALRWENFPLSEKAVILAGFVKNDIRDVNFTRRTDRRDEFDERIRLWYLIVRANARRHTGTRKRTRSGLTWIVKIGEIRRKRGFTIETRWWGVHGSCEHVQTDLSTLREVHFGTRANRSSPAQLDLHHWYLAVSYTHLRAHET